jgi:2-iminobutanoate/2-iminopropanoate deaminase
MHTAVNPEGFPVNPVYSQGLLTQAGGRTLYVSGQVGIGPDGQPAEGIAAQTRAAIANLNAVLAAAGMAPENLAKVTIYLTDPANIGGFMEAGGGSLPNPPPATTLLVVAALASPDLLVEIEAVAVG